MEEYLGLDTILRRDKYDDSLNHADGSALACHSAKKNFKMGVKSEDVWNKLSAMTQTLTGLCLTVHS